MADRIRTGRNAKDPGCGNMAGIRDTRCLRWDAGEVRWLRTGRPDPTGPYLEKRHPPFSFSFRPPPSSLQPVQLGVTAAWGSLGQTCCFDEGASLQQQAEDSECVIGVDGDKV